MTYLLWILSFFLVLYMVKVVRGPEIWDRLLGLSLISSKVVIISVVLASMYELTFLLDFAIVYTILGFICIIFIGFFMVDRKKEGEK